MQTMLKRVTPRAQTSAALTGFPVFGKKHSSAMCETVPAIPLFGVS